MRATLLALYAGCAGAEADPQKPSGPEGPIVIELFTSQGCSSCPPADALLAKIAADGTVNGRAIAPLSFHVDYWNDLGWADPFSLPAWTERQHDYARSLGDDRVYTPELVVAGGAGMVGSQAGAVATAIAKAPRQAVLPATAVWDAARVAVTATAPANADVLVAIYETTTTTSVTRGENSGETLGSDRVVRRLELVARAGQRGTLALPIDPKWRGVGAVAFAQRADRHIIAAAMLPRS
jgi:hypothetical protein